MLKLMYSEAGLQLEQLAQPLERWLSQRLILSLQAGEQLFIEPCTASLLLPNALPELQALRTTVQTASAPTVTLSPCDAETIEISLQGTWLSASSNGCGLLPTGHRQVYDHGTEGVFVAVLGDRLEFLIFKLWQTAQRCSPPLQ